ncbi:MAG: efflux RND transporter periplasmic adaptor subunit [Betaproteobacteria bacterium]|nr:efflux RND transporter periplasmic adaptor subunit [Betaproteobacteria bacterium]
MGAAYIAWNYWRASNEKSIEERYRFEEVRRADLLQSVTANGTLNPLTLVSVGTQVSGTVVALRADFNDKVAQGQTLLELDATTFRAAVEQSSGEVSNMRSQLKLAMAEEARMHQLFSQEYVSRQELERAIQGRETAQALLRTALGKLARDNANLAYTVIRSPVSGVVVSREVDVGQTVAASFQTPTLFKIAKDLSVMRVDSNVAEADVGKIRVGQGVRLTVDAFPEHKFEGEVQQIRLNPITQQNVVTYNVVVHVQNKDLKLMPGMTAYLNVQIEKRANALLVPNAALRFKPSAKERTEPRKREGSNPAEKPRGRPTTVHVLRLGKLVPVTLAIGIADSRFSEVLSGDIGEGEQVVVEELLSEPSAGGAPQPFRMRVF